ncbi:MAG TPA: DUF1467 family protein [Hyphomicrobiales bacterium]|nr:DUF1467 family protein [Kaistiaceae bacterium]HQF30135.1 DUF1467 family protein [Hyphomicrobiales bacterium]
MSLASGLAIYFIIWWLTLFAVLPWRVSTQADVGEVVPGSNPSAPARPHLLVKLAVTTVVAAIIFAAFLYAKLELGITLGDLPLPRFEQQN